MAVQLTKAKHRVFEAIFQFPALDKMHPTFHTVFQESLVVRIVAPASSRLWKRALIGEVFSGNQYHTLSAIAANHPGKCSLALRNQPSLETHGAL